MCSKVMAAGGVVTDPAGVAPDRYVYYPGTEALAKKEIRVTACGTGMPAARHRMRLWTAIWRSTTCRMRIGVQA